MNLSAQFAWLLPLGIFAGAAAIGYGIRSLLIKRLTESAEKTESRTDRLILDATRTASYAWILILAILAMFQIPQSLPPHILLIVYKLLISLLILSITMATARIATDLISESIQTMGLIQTAARWIIFILGALFIFSANGINVTPALTALGVGGLAVALALQDTLSNLFAGLAVTFIRQIRVGQRIHLDSGQEGYVVDIGWRTTTLRDPSDYLIIIPNSKIAQSIITNYNLPTNPVNIVMTVGVSYDSDPEQVQRVLLEECQKVIQEVAGFVKTFNPIIRLQELGQSSINFLLVLRVETYDIQYGLRSEINKRIFKRLKAEGISIPFPTQTILLQTVQTANPPGQAET